MEWEVALIVWIQTNLGALGKILGSVFSFLGGEKGLLLLLLGTMFCWKKKTGQKLSLMITSLLAWNAMIKAVVMRPRPYIEHPDRITPYVKPSTQDAAVHDVAAQGYSFPSMHAGTIPAGYFTLAESVGKKWMYILAAVLTVLGGISRVAAGVHYPTDVLVGWALGFAAIGIFKLLEKYVPNNLYQHLFLLVTTLPGIFFVRTEEYYTTIGMLVGAVLAIQFDERYVHFEDTRNVWAMAARIIGALLIYVVVNSILKLPFSADFLESKTMAALLVRSVRYMIIIFLTLGIYPKVFPYCQLPGTEVPGLKEFSAR